MDRATVMSKISKLMELGSKNPSKAEAEEALKKARFLMVSYHITSAELGDNENDITEASSKIYTRSAWKRKIGFIIAGRFRCVLYYRGHHGAQRMCFLGHDLDSQAALKSYEYTVQYADRSSMAYLRQNGGHKGDWMYGFLIGLEEVFKEQDNNWNKAGNLDMVAVTRAPYDVMARFEELFKDVKPKHFSTDILDGGDENTVWAGFKTGRAYGSGKMLSMGGEELV